MAREDSAADAPSGETGEKEGSGSDESGSDGGTGDRPVPARVREWSGRRLAQVGGWSRRQRLVRGGGTAAFVALVVLVAILPASVLGLVVNDTATFSAAPAAPDAATVAETGYELQSSEVVTVEREVSVAGQVRTIAVRNHQRVYEHHVTVGNENYTKGVFAVVSTPAVRIAGAARNPVADASHREILERFGSQLTDNGGNLSFERAGDREGVLDRKPVRVLEFRTSVAVSETKRQVAVYVGRVRSEDDVVIVVGVHPTAFPGQRVSLFELLYAVKHPRSGSR